MTLSLSLFPALACLCIPVFADEWDQLKSQYATVSVLGGLGAANGDNNPNEWNDAEGLPALEAELSEPHSAMADIQGRVFIADKNAHAIRRIDPDGTIHTVAGMNPSETGGVTAGFNGDGLARQCLLNGPQHAYVLPDGTFYILDGFNFRVRRVDTAGNLTTLITDTAALNRGLWVRRDAQVIYYCTFTELKRWTPALGNSPGEVVASGFTETGNIDVDPNGIIYACDRGTAFVYRVPPTFGGAPIDATMIVAGTGGTTDSGRASDGSSATQVGLVGVRGIAFHPLGGYFLATHKGGDVWYVDSAGKAWLFVEGDSRNAHTAAPVPVPTDGIVMSEPRSVSVSLSGDVIIACNDAGFIRIVRNVLPQPPAPVWDQQTFLPGSGINLRWQSSAGQWYFLERSDHLKPDAWSFVTMLPATGASASFTDPAGVTSRRAFYRLREFRAWPN